MNKTLIITGDSAFESIYRYTKIDNADIEYAFYGRKSIILSFLRIIWMKFSFPCKQKWYRKIDFKRYNTIILLDTYIDLDYLKYVNEITSDTQRKHFYFWNAYKNSRLNAKDIKIQNYTIWSFDYEDCQRYGFSYNPQFYAKSWYDGIDIEPYADIIIVGRDKDGRVKEIDAFFKKCENMGITCRTYITAGKWYKRFLSKRYQKYLDFKSMISKECEGRTVLDYGVSYQYGPTLRVYDAICNGRKVITNNKGVKKLAFYSKENFYIIGEDSFDRIKTFVIEPFSPVISEKIAYYSAEKWVERFCNNNI